MNIYKDLGVRQVINAFGNLTTLGGSIMDPRVLEAMVAASNCYVDMNDLLNKAGQRIAKQVGVEAAYITSGSSAGLAIATAACIAGKDPEKIRRLPNTNGMKSEAIIHKCQRNVWDQAVRLAGATLIEIGTTTETKASDLGSSISDQTIAILYFLEHNENQSIPLQDLIAIAKSHNLPVIVDAAAILPPAENLHRFNDMGADLVIFSGGKMIGGPQSTGLILGNPELIEACALNASPNFSLCRPMKVCKEEIAGLLKALDLFLEHDFQVDLRRWERQVSNIIDAVQPIDGVVAWRVFPGKDWIMPRQVPRVYIDWDDQSLSLSKPELQQKLLTGEPSIAVGWINNNIIINPITLLDGEEKIIAKRLVETLTAS